MESRQSFYLHQFAKEQPDLNWRNPKVVEEMEVCINSISSFLPTEFKHLNHIKYLLILIILLQAVFQFWLDRGVDGFRVDAIDTLFENNYDMDEPRSDIPDAFPVSHIMHLLELHCMVKLWFICCKLVIYIYTCMHNLFKFPLKGCHQR